MLQRFTLGQMAVSALIVLTLLLTFPSPGQATNRQAQVGVWNGFLEQINIVECSNLTSKKLEGTLRIWNHLGREIGTQEISLSGSASQHIILNDIIQPADFNEHYGLYTINGINREFVFCQTATYRSANRGDKRFSYAHAIPAGRNVFGPVAGIYNSIDPTGSNIPVNNFLTLYNPGSSSLDLRVLVYNQGQLTREILVSGLDVRERRDISLGQQNGEQMGVYRIVPSDPAAIYGAFLTRYGSANNDFTFAFPLRPNRAVCDSGPMSASTMGAAHNWLEVANLDNNTRTFEIEVFDRHGAQASLLPTSSGSTNLSPKLAPNQVYNLFLNDFIGKENVGSVRVDCGQPSRTARLVVQSVFYGGLADGPAVRWAYASQSHPINQNIVSYVFPFNTYLNAANWLKVFNQDLTASSDVRFYRENGTAYQVNSSFQFTQGNGDISVHQAGNGSGGPVEPDQIGIVVTTREKGTSFQAELLRVFMDPMDGSQIDTIMPVMGAAIVED